MRDYQKEFENRVEFIRQMVADSHASGIVSVSYTHLTLPTKA